MQIPTTVLNAIQQSWGWTGLEPAAVTATNEFGNLIVRATDGAHWHICPEALSCKVVAFGTDDFEAIWADFSFQRDWQMRRLVDAAAAKLGPLTTEDRCYCLKLAAVLGGKYDASNFGTISRAELIAFSGDLAKKIKYLPDGKEVRITSTR